MTRRRLLLATIGLVALIAVAVTGMIYAGTSSQAEDNVPIPGHAESIREIIQKHEGDDTVLATVNGHDFTAQQLRVGYESLMLVEPDLTEKEAIKATILSRLDAVLLASEAESRGLTTTQDEARALVERNKTVCEEDAEVEAECRDVLERMGLDYDEYWEGMVVTYQETATQAKVWTFCGRSIKRQQGRPVMAKKGNILIGGSWIPCGRTRKSSGMTKT